MCAGASPVASEDDCAYWSAEPKLVVVNREEVTNLFGLSIMTREVGKDVSDSRWLCSGASLLWTPWGPGEVSHIERCPRFRGKFTSRKHT